MSVDTRNVTRDSLFLFADLSFEGQAETVRVKVRNISAGGMMAEGGSAVETGQRLSVTLRNVGEVRGTVAWVQGNRFGIAFEEAVDPLKVRAPQGAPTDETTPRYAKPLLTPSPYESSDRTLRRL